MSLPSDLPFTSFLRYSPYGTTATSRLSKDVTVAIKNDSNVLLKSGLHPAIKYSAIRLSDERPKHQVLQQVFVGGEILVPMPRRAPLVTGGLWPTRKLCEHMLDRGLGASVLPLLSRKVAVQKSATAAKGQRPGPQAHYDSVEVDGDRPMLPGGQRIVLVDDVITRGATMVGCYARLREAYPANPILCFALVRTMSGAEVDSLIDPVAGTIDFSGLYLHRTP